MAEFRTIMARVARINLEKGWSEPLSPEGSKHRVLEDTAEFALIMTEASEGIEEIRDGREELYFSGGYVGDAIDGVVWGKLEDDESHDLNGELRKPEGARSELADVVIRAMHLAAKRGWDLEGDIALKLDYNATRPSRHGGKLV